MARLADWNERVERAENGHKALTIAVSFLLAQIKRLDHVRPEDAEAARWHIAREIAKFAASLMRRTRTRKEAGSA